VCKDRASSKRASGDKKDRVIDPNTFEPTEVPVHANLVAEVIGLGQLGRVSQKAAADDRGYNARLKQ
jgi:hypothetical protein